ncbi:GNAT family N-acetyltransferase [Saccharothrix sp. S26]|uniref:GNAT family N-acetyltransferase n=1 Tax=Saccharothrix sp. S26 TaxID=2907215 RepID=UPI001F357640|nr:GNAT family N-acetyltransferase [Saccharothrix sp. S26]MCE7000746.1 GNAT family N-acetyltransferase [Saccharothrix sp. S26]
MTTSPIFSGTSLTDLVRRWERGWSVCRGWPRPREAGGALHLLQQRPGRHREIVALHPDDVTGPRALADETASAEEPTWLTVPTTRPEEAEGTLRNAGLHLKATREWLMTRPLADHPRRAVPADYRIAATATEVLAVEVRHRSDEPAASGQAAVTGRDAVFDRIETAPPHRRRGLGGVVMAALAEEAVARGARHGILIASPEGRALYTSLGWVTRAAVVIAVNRPA